MIIKENISLLEKSTLCSLEIVEENDSCLTKKKKGMDHYESFKEQEKTGT